MIDTAALLLSPTLPEKSPPARDDAPVFSFAAALNAMTAQASQSLKTHGGAPSATNAIGEKPAPPRHDGSASQQDVSRNVPLARGEETSPATAQKSGASAASSLTQSPSAPLVTPAAIHTVPLSHNAAPHPAAPLQAGLSTVKLDGAALRAPDLARTSEMKAPKAPTATAQPQAPTDGFAKLLSRRLEGGATQFEMRLDPPSLGRVEASLRLAEKGDNILVLKFEHQAALDLFANDHATLRTMLSASGFEFSGERMVFERAQAPNDVTQQSERAAKADIPSFLAPWSTGAVDIRI